MAKLVKVKFVLLVLVGLFFVASQAQAQLPMQFTFHDPCGGGNADFCAPVMIGRGVFHETTVLNFRTALNQFRRANSISGGVVGISALIFDSPGGSLAAGIQLGSELRRLRITTRAVSEFDEVVKTKPDGDYGSRSVLRNAKCLSACAYAFLGGIKRSVESDKYLGVHQFKSALDRDFSESAAQKTTAQLAIYVESMGISSRFVTIASLTGSNEITYISAMSSRELKVDNVNISLANWSVSATDEGLPLLVLTQPLSVSHRVAIRVSVKGETVYVETNTLIDLKLTTLARAAQFPEGSPPTINITVDGREFRGTPIKVWTRAIYGDEVSFASTSAFPKALLSALKEATSVTISDDFGRATSDISLDTHISLTGLRAGVALLSRAR
jgi:hypothetical protein